MRLLLTGFFSISFIWAASPVFAERVGADAGSITCILATTKNAKGEIVWRSDYLNNVSVAKEKNLDCGVSPFAEEPDIPAEITLSMRGEQSFRVDEVEAEACHLAIDKASANAFARTSRTLGISKSVYEDHIKSVELTSKNVYESNRKMVCSIYAQITVSRDKVDGAVAIARAFGSEIIAKQASEKTSPASQTALESAPTKRDAELVPSVASVQQSEELDRLRNEIRALRARQEQSLEREQKISNDNEPPRLIITRQTVEGVKAFIEGRAMDNVEVAELLINGKPVSLDADGNFEYSAYVPTSGAQFQVVVFDQAGLSAEDGISMRRNVTLRSPSLAFDKLNPTSRGAKQNKKAVALVIGVSEYSLTAPAEFADRDAQVFYDYAHLKLGIPQERIQTLVNDSASVVGMLSGINKWLKRSVKQGESDVYIFFAGHGLASDDGDTAFLIPYDGAPDFLERTAISRDEVFREVSSVNPRSVTVFLDTCYSGDTRGETRLIAGRPLSIKLQEQSLPKGFTVLTAAGGDQIAKPLKEAQHGMFSYFLMKGMEGGADSNSDNQITARELHTYVRENVVQQSGGSQVPELQGDAERVLVRFR